jgi:DNA-binding PadR family transcriptional regulator
MSIELTATSYLVLGLLAREGPSTPYDLKRHVAATLGHFWPFPHTLLYSEPVRLSDVGLVSETRELEGRRRRLFAITAMGLTALQEWLARPSLEAPQLRDPGLLQLFFADLGPPEARHDLAAVRLAIHRGRLAALDDERRLERGGPGQGAAGQGAAGQGGAGERARPGNRSVEHWRGETLDLGRRYERAAVEFWSGIARDPTAAVSGTPAGARVDARSAVEDTDGAWRDTGGEA